MQETVVSPPKTAILLTKRPPSCLGSQTRVVKPSERANKKAPPSEFSSTLLTIRVCSTLSAKNKERILEDYTLLAVQNTVLSQLICIPQT